MFQWIHSPRRNRLSEQRANDLVFVSSNLRLLRRSKKMAEMGEHDIPIAWAEDNGEEEDLSNQSERGGEEERVTVL